jgi:hypothetical protein
MNLTPLKLCASVASTLIASCCHCDPGLLMVVCQEQASFFNLVLAAAFMLFVSLVLSALYGFG